MILLYVWEYLENSFEEGDEKFFFFSIAHVRSFLGILYSECGAHVNVIIGAADGGTVGSGQWSHHSEAALSCEFPQPGVCRKHHGSARLGSAKGAA